MSGQEANTEAASESLASAGAGVRGCMQAAWSRLGDSSGHGNLFQLESRPGTAAGSRADAVRAARRSETVSVAHLFELGLFGAGLIGVALHFLGVL